MDELPKGPRARPYSVAQSAPHQILVCRACKHKGDACKPGFELLKKLRAAIQEMLDHDGPFVLDVIVPYTEHVLPMIPAGRTVKDMLLK